VRAGRPPARAVFWDVDGTLLHAGGAGGDAFVTGFADALGARVDRGAVAMAGGTDPQLALEYLDLLGYSDDAASAALPLVLAAIERALRADVARITAKGHPHPGVPELLAALAARHVVQTLVTGNLLANARIKIEALELSAHLEYALGAYGSDHHDRNALVPLALSRLRRADIDASPQECWVIGDTPRDLACARAGGVRCLLVATGSHDYEELAEQGADAVVRDLSATDEVLAILGL